MRKLKLQVQLSIDGFIAGVNGEMDWMVWDWDEKLKTYVNELTEPVDLIVMGRKIASGFISYWEEIAAKPDDPQFQFAKKMTDTPKVIFTKTLAKSQWNNTVIAKGSLLEEVTALKAKSGNDIIVYGGAGIVSSLINEGFIDELHLFINPTAIGQGMAIFQSLTTKQTYKLVQSTGYDCGIVVNKYLLKK